MSGIGKLDDLLQGLSIDGLSKPLDEIEKKARALRCSTHPRRKAAAYTQASRMCKECLEAYEASLTSENKSDPNLRRIQGWAFSSENCGLRGKK